MKIPAILQLHFIVFLWGFTGILGKLITMPAVPMVWVRILITFFVIYIYLRIKKIDLKVSKKIFFQLLACGTVIGIHWVLFFLAIKISNVSIALSTLSCGTLFAALLEPIFFKRKISIPEILLSLIIIVCIATIFKTEFHFWQGILVGVSCSFFSALFAVLNGKMYKKADSSVVVLYELLGGLGILTLFLLVNQQFSEIINVSPLNLLWLLILGILLTAYPMVKTVSLMKEFKPFTLMLSVNLEPVYTIIFAYLIWTDTEAMSLSFYCASLVMLAAIICNGYLKSISSSKNKI